MIPGVLDMALRVWAAEVDEERIARAKQRHAGPYRVEAVGPYGVHIIVGASGTNCFGRLWSKEYAEEVLKRMA